MSWIEIYTRLSELPEDWSPWIEIYREHGSENTLQTDTPATLTGCLVKVSGVDERIVSLKAALESLGAESVVVRDVPEVNWEENWKQFFKPRKIGQGFVVCPTWEELPAEWKGENLHVITLDPGQAFGTGDHPTTRLCLELMQTVPVEGKRVADVGCGSGILSIGAAMLGAAYVAAVDIEPLAVEVAKENRDLNKVKFDCVAGDGLSTLAMISPAPWDLVISNIISATLMRIGPDVAKVLAPGGKWMVSGVIEANWPLVRSNLMRAGFSVENEREEDGWIAAVFSRE